MMPVMVVAVVGMPVTACAVSAGSAAVVVVRMGIMMSLASPRGSYSRDGASTPETRRAP